jgi:hypothetical protein
MTKKVMFAGTWGESPVDMLKRYSNQTPNNSGVWKDIQGVSNQGEADYIVALDGFSNSEISSVDWSKIIYLQREPNTIRPHFMGHSFPPDIFFEGTMDAIHPIQTWWINMPFDDLCKLSYPKKTKKISTITSGKSSMIEYVERLQFLKDFCDTYGDIDVYGRGTQEVVPRFWRGELNYDGKCKFKGHEDYEYSLALENVHYPNSWSEKPCDSILSWALPIYSGASNFGEYFPQESFHQINLKNCDMEEIIEFISEPPTKIQIEALREARELILYKYNIWPTIKNIIDENL